MADGKNIQSGLLGRWSERKRAARTAERPENAGEADSPASVDEPLMERAEAPARELTDADMPPVDSLNEHSDFSGFLSPKVGEALRRQALRKLFHLPSFNITDGLDDYDEDYTRSNVLVEWASRKLALRDHGRTAIADKASIPTTATESASATAMPVRHEADVARRNEEDELSADQSDA